MISTPSWLGRSLRISTALVSSMASRRTRFVLISDTHNSNPRDGFRLPKGDVLIHAGDLTNQGTLAELQKTVRWIEDADFELKIVVAGNRGSSLFRVNTA